MPISASAAAFAFIAALIGAGFASGKEIEQFFARFGAWGLLLAALCALMLFALTYALLIVCRRFQASSVPALCARVAPHGCAVLCRWLLTLLLCDSAGAMLCAGGELLSLLLPLRAAYWLGFAITLGWGVFLSVRSLRALGMLGRLLVPLMAALLLLLLRLKPVQVLSISPRPSPVLGLGLALCYAPLNLALSGGVICEAAQTLDARKSRSAACSFALGTGMLLMLGTLVLMRHQGQIQSAALPFVVLCARLGKPGFYACAAMLYLAVLSTLTALLRALWNTPDAQIPLFSCFPCAISPEVKQRAGRVLSTLACALCALVGFDRLIAAAYPVLGALCGVMLLLVLARAFACYSSER